MVPSSPMDNITNTYRGLVSQLPFSPSTYNAPSSTSSQPSHTYRRNRFSSFFHGTSTMDRHQASRPTTTTTALPRLDMSHLYNPAPRSPTSTRSIIESATPSSCTRPLSMATFDSPISEVSPMSPRAHLLSPRLPSINERPLYRKPVKRVRPGPRWRPRHDRGRMWWPGMGRRSMRTKIFHCILSGSLLALTLVVFLSLALSGTAYGEGFHIIMILFLLLFTVVFTHSLIRLCMLVHASRTRNPRERRRQRPVLEEYSYPDEPVRVVLAIDEEMGYGAGNAEDEKDLPPPPPAYGLWRGSVRIDPALVRWQRAGHTTLTSPVEDGQRPPSYVHDDHVLGCMS